MALFGEKYGEVVRVVSIGGDWSRELCAGTHLGTTGQVGRIMLLGESSIGSGVRRVEALVGDGAYHHQAKEHALVSQLALLLKVPADDLADKVDALVNRLREADKQIAALRLQQLIDQIPQIKAEPPSHVGQIRLVSRDFADQADKDPLGTIALSLRDQLGEAEPTVIVLAGRANGRVILVVATNAAARQAGVRAGALAKAASTTLGGGGGGRDDYAFGGGPDADKVGEAIAGTVIGQLAKQQAGL
jgi:alanyl-tRNA synthetase